jgi:exosortase family protein XrtF
MWKEFRPAFRFLFIFLALYLAGNVVYGLFIESYGSTPDPMTKVVAVQTAAVLRATGAVVEAVHNTQGPTVFLRNEIKTVLNIYEGCNGLNVMIVFVAFVVAFGGKPRKMSWFLIAGLVVIHLFNVIRITLLYFVAIGYQRYFYYVHKYIFTGILYAIVFLLWYVWINRINGKAKQAAAA